MILEDLPASSSPLPWQGELWSQLLGQWQKGQLPHALLLAGPPGTGKAQFALALARRLLCAQPDGPTNCGQCHACELSAAGSHGDFRWLQPEGSSRVIKVDQVRSAIQFSQGTAVFGAAKVLVFQPADRMNIAAYNALLKSLEEPVADTYLILVCDSLHGIPATIRSRCQIQRLPPPSDEAGRQWLETVTGDGAHSEQLMMLAEGRPMRAYELFLSDAAEEAAAHRLAIRALLAGELSATAIWDHFKDLGPEDFLQLYASELRQMLHDSPVDELRGERGRAAFELLDRTTEMMRAVSAGANPGRQLLTDLFLSKSHIELGRQ